MKVNEEELKQDLVVRLVELHKRLESFIKIYDEEHEYPLSFMLYGFPKLVLESRDELKFRIKEICDILKIHCYIDTSSIVLNEDNYTKTLKAIRGERDG